MMRTTVMLPLDLKHRSQALARRMGISLGQLIRESLEASLRGDVGELREPTLYADAATYDGPLGADFSENHDDYLYDAGEEPSRP